MATPEVVTEVALAHQAQAGLTRAEDFMPLMTVAQAVARKGQINEFIAKVMREGEDYGAIPGAGKKKVLLKPGAEKLCSIFGMSPTFERVTCVEDWTGAEHGGEPMFFYEYRCQLSRGGRFMGEAMGSANSWESKHRYRWVPEDVAKSYGHDPAKLASRGGLKTLFEPLFAYEKQETTGQYGKPAEHWAAFDAAIKEGTARRATRQNRKGGDMPGWEIDVDQKQFRIPNPDVADAVNTLVKIAQKRALVAVVLIVTNCSDAFTQDLDDFEPPEGAGPMPDTGGHPVGTQAAADHVAETKIAEAKKAAAKPNEPAPRFTVGDQEMDVPTPLIGIFRALDSLHEQTADVQKSRVKAACGLLEKELVTKRGKDGGAYYQRMTEDFHHEHPVVTLAEIPALKVLLYKLWLEANKEAVHA